MKCFFFLIIYNFLKVLKFEYLIDNSSNEIPFFCINRGNETEILIVEEEHYEKWLFALRRKCIMTCFSHLYKIIEDIGSGGFGRVVKCKSNEDGREVAVKLYSKEKIFSNSNPEEFIVYFLKKKN